MLTYYITTLDYIKAINYRFFLPIKINMVTNKRDLHINNYSVNNKSMKFSLLKEETSNILKVKDLSERKNGNEIIYIDNKPYLPISFYQEILMTSDLKSYNYSKLLFQFKSDLTLCQLCSVSMKYQNVSSFSMHQLFKCISYKDYILPFVLGIFALSYRKQRVVYKSSRFKSFTISLLKSSAFSCISVCGLFYYYSLFYKDYVNKEFIDRIKKKI